MASRGKLDVALRSPVLVTQNRSLTGGDFHFLVHSARLLRALHVFARLPHVALRSNSTFLEHRWIRDALLSAGSLNVVYDNIRPGSQEEVYRKLPTSPIGCLGPAALDSRYGLSATEWAELVRATVDETTRFSRDSCPTMSRVGIESRYFLR